MNFSQFESCDSLVCRYTQSIINQPKDNIMSFDNLKQDLQRERRNLDRDLAELRLIQQPEECFTLEQLSQYTGYTRERIRCIEKAALRKLHVLLNDTLVQERFEPIR